MTKPTTQDTDVTAGPPRQFSESLKRIGEQAKDWEEIPRARKEKSATASPATPVAAETSPATTAAPQLAPSGMVSVPKWAIGLMAVLLVVSSGLLVWLGLQAVALNKTVADQARALTEISTEMKQISEALGTWRAEVQAAIEANAKAVAEATHK